MSPVGRYKVVAGSQSGHCCFDCTVVDTTKPSHGDTFELICECFDMDEAQTIADALNATSAQLAEV